MEFKFKIWHKDEQEMFYMKDIEYINFKDRIIRFENEHYSFFEYLDSDNIVILKYTGLKDKNGVEIYEGDIIKDKFCNIGYVIFLQQEMGYVVVYKNFDSRLGHRNTGSCYEIDINIEAIGNIYENKELLEVTI